VQREDRQLDADRYKDRQDDEGANARHPPKDENGERVADDAAHNILLVGGRCVVGRGGRYVVDGFVFDGVVFDGFGC